MPGYGKDCAPRVHLPHSCHSILVCDGPHTTMCTSNGISGRMCNIKADHCSKEIGFCLSCMRTLLPHVQVLEAGLI